MLDAAGNEITGNQELDDAAQAHFQELVIDPELESAANLDSKDASPTGGEGAGQDPSGSVGSDPNLSTDKWDWEDGYSLTKQQARSYAELEAFLYANPEKAQTLANFLNNNDQVPQAPDKPSEELDLESIIDPEVKAIALENRRMLAELEQLKTQQSGLNEYVNVQQEQTATSLMNRATTSFKDQHKLSDEEMGRLSEVTARLNILPSLMNPVDPISGQVRKVDPLAAIEEALETAYWQIPEFRTRAISNEVEAQTANKVRKSKLSSLQGGSGSIPREQPVSQTQQGRREQMIAEVAQMIGKG